MSEIADTIVASVNGVVLHPVGVTVAAEQLRQRACTELLRQEAQAAGLLAQEDQTCADGVISEAAAALRHGVASVPSPPRWQSAHRRDRSRSRGYAAVAMTWPVTIARNTWPFDCGTRAVQFQ
jgi:hypothetical protein